MNLNELYQDLSDKKFTDMELVLIDQNESITIHTHKVILACSSNYFKKLLTFGNEKNKTMNEIHVRNSKIAHDMILQFYGKNINSTNYPEWKYILEKSDFLLKSDLANTLALRGFGNDYL